MKKNKIEPLPHTIYKINYMDNKYCLPFCRLSFHFVEHVPSNQTGKPNVSSPQKQYYMYVSHMGVG